MNEILIEKVKEHECIYDNNSPNYRDQNIRQAAWEEIGKELQIPGNKAKERWDRLRRCFCNARNRRREVTKSGMASKQKASWKYDQQMSFIIPFIETRKTHRNLNKSQASTNLAESGDLSEESELEESTPHLLKREHIDTESEQSIQINQANDRVINNAEIIKKCYEAVKLSQNKISDTPTHQIIQSFKKSSALKRHRSIHPKTTKTTSFLENLDDTDIFFLSMSKMTKQLPRFEQANIKLALSNSVLTAEVRYHQQSFSTTAFPQHSVYHNRIQQNSSPSPTSSSIHTMTSPGDLSQDDEYMKNTAENRRPTSIEMVSIPHTTYQINE